MLLLLLLAIRTSGEWVEISQHPRRAEPSWRDSAGSGDAAETNNIYANYSLTEQVWNKSGLPTITNFGSVRRVQLQGKGEVIPSTSDSGYESIGPVRALNIKVTENIQTDIGKRQHNIHFGTLNKTNVRSTNPSLHSDREIEKTLSEGSNVFNVSARIIKKNNYREIKITDENDNAGISYKQLEVNPYIKRFPNDYGFGISKEKHIDKGAHLDIEQYPNESENKLKNKSDDITRNSDTTFTITNKTLIKIGIAKEIHGGEPKIKKKTDTNFDLNVERENVNLSGDTKTNAAELIWKLMKIVTDNISRNTRRNFRSKIRFLEDLKNDIMANIAERVEQTWPDDVKTGGARRRRAEAARGHVEFPSSESALMTISFLTFAVFLIKLVLQVIHTYKNKTMMVTPAVVAAVGRAAAAAAFRDRSHP